MKGAVRFCAWAHTVDEVLTRLRWMNDILGPTLDAALKDCGGVDIRALLGKALHMGDDGHNRLDAASLLFTTALAPSIVRSRSRYQNCRRDDPIPGR